LAWPVPVADSSSAAVAQTAPATAFTASAPLHPVAPIPVRHPPQLSAHAWAIARSIAERFNAYAGKSTSSTASAYRPNSQRLQHYRQLARHLAKHLQHVSHTAAYRRDQSIGKRLWHWVQRYHPYVQVKNGRYVLRTEIGGVPVIPPGMTGAQLQEFLDHRSLEIQQHTATTLVFISLSMPKTVLRRMFADAWDNPYLRTHTIFVFRGWPPVPDGLQELVSRVIRLFPKPKDQPTVEIDPMLFTGHRVTRVPVVLHEIRGTHRWGAIVGDGYGLDAAIHRIDRGKGSNTKIFGRVWRIAEPNLIDVILQRARHYDWTAAEARARRQNLEVLSQQLAVHLPESTKPLNYLWDPAVVAQHNIVLPDGQTLAYAGERINPLRYYPEEISRTYIIFNPAKRWQVQDVRGWLSVYRDPLLMATRLPARPAALRRLDQYLQHFVYATSPLLVSRLGVRATPALITIDHYRLHIQVPAIPRDAPPEVSHEIHAP